MRLLTATLAFLLLSLCPLYGSETSPSTIRIGVDPNYPPFSEIDDQGQLQGFDIDIALALCVKMQVECELVQQEWKALIPMLRTGLFDAIVSSMSITESRRKRVDFTDRYYSNIVRFVALKSSFFNPENPQGSTIGVAPGTVSSDWLEANLSEVVKIQYYTDQSASFQALTDGEVDAIFGDGLGFWNWLQSPQGAHSTFIGDSYHIDEGIGIAVRKGEEQLRRNLNHAIKAILGDGTYEQINAKYFPFSIY